MIVKSKKKSTRKRISNKGKIGQIGSTGTELDEMIAESTGGFNLTPRSDFVEDIKIANYSTSNEFGDIMNHTGEGYEKEVKMHYQTRLIGAIKHLFGARVEEYNQRMLKIKPRSMLEEEARNNLVLEPKTLYELIQSGAKIPKTFGELVDVLGLDKEFFFNTTIEKEIEKWRKENGLYTQTENNLNTDGKSEDKMTEMIGTYKIEKGTESVRSIDEIFNPEEAIKESQLEDKRTRDEVLDETHKRVYAGMRENPQSKLYKNRSSNEIDVLGNLRIRDEGINDAHKRTYLAMKENPASKIYNGRSKQINPLANIEAREKAIDESRENMWGKSEVLSYRSNRVEDIRTAREKPYVGKKGSFAEYLLG
ncbi:MAG: hypothetical protein AABX93_02755 [Nanoarchaeota archaeon]